MQKCMQFSAAALRLAALYAPFAWRAYPFCVAERCMAIGLVNTNPKTLVACWVPLTCACDMHSVL